MPPSRRSKRKEDRQSIRVCARFRPLNAVERGWGGDKQALPIVLEERVVVAQKPAGAKLLDDQQHKGTSDARQRFAFDAVFPVTTTQEEVFQATAAPMVAEVLAGYNCTIFAYGQTGSGKTHTMMGYSQDAIADAGTLADQLSTEYDEEDNNIQASEEEKASFRWQTAAEMGIIPRLVKAIFDGIMEHPPGFEFTVQVQYVEIYLEKIRDLLHPEHNNLKIRENKTRGIYIQDVTEVYVGSFEEVLQVMERGETNRSISATRMNKKSSRSHSVFIMRVMQRNLETSSKKVAKLVLVDLAGSEKVQKTGAAGLTLLQARHTNKSLAALGNVINALTSGSSHVPYRDSKLTRLLQDSIGGNSKTCLIITGSMSAYNLEETYSTLRFGERAKTIKNKPKVNAEKTISEYKQIVSGLKKKVKEQARVIETLERDVNSIMAAAQQQGVDLSTVEIASSPTPSANNTPAKGAPPAATAKTPERLIPPDATPRSVSPSDADLSDMDSDDEDDMFVDPTSWMSKGGAAAKHIANNALKELQERNLVLQATLAQSKELEEELRDQLLHKETYADEREQEVLELKQKLSAQRKKLSKAELYVLELNEAVAKAELDSKTAELMAQENQLVVQQLQDDNKELVAEQEKLLARVSSLERALEAAKGGASAMAPSSSSGNVGGGPAPVFTSPSQVDITADEERDILAELEQEQLQEDKDHLEAENAQLKAELKEQRGQTQSLEDQLKASKREYERLLSDFGHKSAEVARLEMEKVKTDSSGGSESTYSLNSSLSPVSSPGASPSRALKPKAGAHHAESNALASTEELQEKVQQAEDKNLWLKMENEDLKWQLKMDQEEYKILEKRYNALKAKGVAIVNMDEPDEPPPLPEEHSGTIRLPKQSVYENIAKASGTKREQLMHKTIQELKVAAERLRGQNDYHERRYKYVKKLVSNKKQHIAVLEDALHHSNDLHRKTAMEHIKKIRMMETEIEYLKRKLKQVRSKRSTGVAPLRHAESVDSLGSGSRSSASIRLTSGGTKKTGSRAILSGADRGGGQNIRKPIMSGRLQPVTISTGKIVPSGSQRKVIASGKSSAPLSSASSPASATPTDDSDASPQTRAKRQPSIFARIFGGGKAGDA